MSYDSYFVHRAVVDMIPEKVCKLTLVSFSPTTGSGAGQPKAGCRERSG